MKPFITYLYSFIIKLIKFTIYKAVYAAICIVHKFILKTSYLYEVFKINKVNNKVNKVNNKTHIDSKTNQ